MKIFLLSAFVACSIATLTTATLAATAALVGQRLGHSVTGQNVIICTYQIGPQRFERAFPMGEQCPMTVEVQ